MVVRVGGQTEPRHLPARLVDGVATTIARGLAAFDTSQRSRRNALAASIELSSTVAERRRVEAFLDDYASARNVSGAQRSREASSSPNDLNQRSQPPQYEQRAIVV
ncbi:MAG: hypothetical protein L0K86_08380 [Actinomycetia bacterium]|nr:hypothetical protein [Actinomycetes bacterium]